MYFANLLTLCHEAYEAALAEAGLDVKGFFSGAGEVAVPIVHAEADFFQPLFCGDAIAIILNPKQLDPHSFEISYAVTRTDSSQEVAQALTRHVSISTQTRRRASLTRELLEWISQAAPLAAAD